MFVCLFFLALLLLLFVFIDVLRVSYLFFTIFNVHNSPSYSVSLHVHVYIDKHADYLQSNNNDSLNDL